MKSYRDYNSYLKTKYGCRVYRIGLDAGFSCPNRDGTKGSGGCIYCDGNGSRASYTDAALPVEKQLSARIEHLKKIKSAQKFIAYFQAFTNTYAPPERLKAVYDSVLPFKEIVGISIGTRPDAVDRDKLRLISYYKKGYEVWLEYGLQSIHDKTLKLINRGHYFKDFLNALEMTKEFGIPVCVHVILGLPGETRDEMIATARRLSELKVEAVKIHLLHILKGTELEKLYNEGKAGILEEDRYVELACDFLENLSGDIIIQRLTGEGERANHIAPLWALNKIDTINRIDRTLKKRETCQGYKLTVNQEFIS